EMLIRFLSDLSALSGKRSALDPDQLRGLNEGEQLEIALKHAVALEILPPDMEASHLENLFELFKKNALAFLNYDPAVYKTDIPVALFRAVEDKDEAKDGEALGWDRIIGSRMRVNRMQGDGAEIFAVPGDHYTIMSGANLSSLVMSMEVWLNEADKSLN